MDLFKPSLFARPDTMLGVCQGLGEDLGINPNWLRLALPLPLFINPAMTVAVYLAAGVVVLLTRLIFPDPTPVELIEEAPPVPVAEAPAEVMVREPEALAA
jgi:phage shock protein PspC (stress-responsive transcriptional regulator)